MALKLLIILTTNILMILADVCIPTQHKIVNDKQIYEVLHGETFKPETNTSTGYFRTMVMDEQHNRLIVGARNYIFYLNDKTLQSDRSIYWNTQSDYDRCLLNPNNLKHVCGNYIQFLGIYENTLLICGTNSLSPKRKITSLTNNAAMHVDEKPHACASPSPDYKTVGTLTNLGEIIAATYTDISDNKSEIFGSYLLKKPLVYRGDLTTRTRKNRDTFENPNFISSISVDDSVYIFFMENAAENDNARTPTVARICKTDNGGASYISSKMWTSYRKARLNCTFNGNEIYHFKNLVSVTYDKDNEVFYAAYTLSRYELMGSAVCTYVKSDVEQSFNSDFLSYEKKTESWKRIKNGAFLNGCKVNPANLSSSVLPVSLGKEPTNSLSFKPLVLALSNNLMQKSIQPKKDGFEYMLPTTRFTEITSENIKLTKKNATTDTTIIYIATETGSIFMVYQSTSQSCVIQEIQTGLKIIRKILLNKQKRILYVSSDEKLVSINVDSCDRYISKSECIQSHNPLCGWNEEATSCDSVALSNNNITLIQDISKCPKRKEFWDSWSDWKPCKQENDKRYCWCRKRNCQTCDKTLCDENDSIQVTNCTASAVDDVEKWSIDGPIDGSWSLWGNWTNCGQSICGVNTVSRTRTCALPKASNGGRNCSGDSYQCKSCAKPPEPCFMFWSGWSQWSTCQNIRPEIYLQKRSRTCSRLTGCSGSTSQSRHCAPEGTIWGEWKNCSCVYHIQHRYPSFITGCDNCEQLKKPEYRQCNPEGCYVPTTTRKTIPDTDSNSNKSRTTTESNEIPFFPTPHTQSQELFRENKDGINLKLRDLIIAAVGVLVTCFLVCTLIIVIILKRKKGNFAFPEPIELQSPELYKNKSIENGIDSLSRIDSMSRDQDMPLMKNVTKV